MARDIAQRLFSISHSLWVFADYNSQCETRHDLCSTTCVLLHALTPRHALMSIQSSTQRLGTTSSAHTSSPVFFVLSCFRFSPSHLNTFRLCFSSGSSANLQSLSVASIVTDGRRLAQHTLYLPAGVVFLGSRSHISAMWFVTFRVGCSARPLFDCQV